MSNQNNRLQQNQQATSQPAVGGAPPFMHPMVMPGRVQRTIFTDRRLVPLSSVDP